ncbi:MAG: M43 family zinc metalloprotease, partial [Rhodothermales bacterium]
MKHLTLLTVTLLLVAAGRSDAQHLCATPEPSSLSGAEYRESLPKSLVSVNVPVFFHVVKTSDGVGNVSDAVIRSHITLLNDAFTGTNYTFTLVGIERVINNTWPGHLSYPGFGYDTDMKNALGIQPEHVLNYYITDVTNSLGYASLPNIDPLYWQEDDIRHGVVLDYASFLSSPEPLYNAGDEGVHEVGHYFGLYHVFQPEGDCDEFNDLVTDTPDQRNSYDHLCPSSGSTCGSPDNFHNYMDYSTDACRYEFTPGQKTRINQRGAAGRPSLGSFTIDVNRDISISSGESLVLENATFLFASGKRLIANSGSTLNVTGATLTAQGTSWGGVYYGPSSSGVLDWSTIEKVNSSGGGAVTLEYSNARLYRNTIKNNTAHGIADLVSNNEDIEYSTIQSNSKHCIYVSSSYGYFTANNIAAATTTSGNSAVYVTGGGPSIKRDAGVNTLNGGYYGIYATSGAVVYASGYTLSQPGNRIFSN